MIPFTKMHTLGNDFVIMDLDQVPNLNATWLQTMGDRHLGIGFDQFLGYRHTQKDQATFAYQIFNADGNESEQCGNGALCLSRYLFDHVIKTDWDTITLQTCNRAMTARRPQPDATIEIGKPDFDPHSLPMQLEAAAQYMLDTTHGNMPFYALSVGNPHAIVMHDQMPAISLEQLGESFNQHPAFPQGVNVSVLTVNDPKHITIQVYERGVGPTQACGSAASASAAVAHHHLQCASTLSVECPGGILNVEIQNGSIWLSGPTTYSFHGEYQH